MEAYYEAIKALSVYSVVLPLLVGLIKIKRLNKPFKVLFIYVVVSFATEQYAVYLLQVIDNNLFLLHIYVAFELLAFLYIYYLILPQNNYRRLIKIYGVVYLVVGVFNAAQNILAYPTYARGVESIMLISLAIIFFYNLIKELSVLRIEKHGYFWMNAGILLYFSGALIIFIIFNYYSQISELKLALYYSFIHSSCNIIKNILFTLAFVYAPWNKIAQT